MNNTPYTTIDDASIDNLVDELYFDASQNESLQPSIIDRVDNAREDVEKELSSFINLSQSFSRIVGHVVKQDTKSL